MVTWDISLILNLRTKWGTIIEDDYPGIDLKKKERTEIEKDIIIRFTKEDLSYAVDRKTGKPLFQ